MNSSRETPKDPDGLLERYAAGERNFSGAKLIGAELRGANPRGANFRRSDLSSRKLLSEINEYEFGDPFDLGFAYLERADLRGANFDEAKLRGTYLDYADLGRSHLRRAYLSSASLHDANLCEADLADAYLRETNLENANLRGANLSGADYTDILHRSVRVLDSERARRWFGSSCESPAGTSDVRRAASAS